MHIAPTPKTWTVSTTSRSVLVTESSWSGGLDLTSRATCLPALKIMWKYLLDVGEIPSGDTAMQIITASLNLLICTRPTNACELSSILTAPWLEEDSEPGIQDFLSAEVIGHHFLIVDRGLNRAYMYYPSICPVPPSHKEEQTNKQTNKQQQQ